MRPVAALFGIALGVLVACQGTDPISPTRDLEPSGKKAGVGGGGGGQRGIILSGGYSSNVGFGVARTKGSSATFDTPTWRRSRARSGSMPTAALPVPISSRSADR